MLIGYSYKTRDILENGMLCFDQTFYYCLSCDKKQNGAEIHSQLYFKDDMKCSKCGKSLIKED